MWNLSPYTQQSPGLSTPGHLVTGSKNQNHAYRSEADCSPTRRAVQTGGHIQGGTDKVAKSQAASRRLIDRACISWPRIVDWGLLAIAGGYNYTLGQGCSGGNHMEYRQLGGSGLKVPVLCFGTGTFGGGNEFFKAWGSTDVAEAKTLIDICMDAGVNFFDTADIYSNGLSEEVLGEAIKGKREKMLLSTKATFRFGDGANDVGSSRYHLIKSVEDSLRRLQTDYIDIYHLHAFDAVTPVEEVLSTLDTLIKSGKIRYIACSNFSGWHLMKSLAVSERYGWAKYIAQQSYYSLIGREFEWELMPLGLDQKVGTLVWSPLGWGRLTGKIRRGQPIPAESRLHKTSEIGPQVSDEYLYKVIDSLDEVAAETGKSVPQVALNWLLQRPTISSIIFGARNEKQLRQNLDSVGWNLTKEQVAKLDAASETSKTYPYWHQQQFVERNPFPV